MVRRGGPGDELARLSDDELLELPLRRLARILGADPAAGCLARPIARLFGELGAKGVGPRPDLWYSTDFFSPDGVAGFAIPFHLAHPRLVALERRRMGSAEGASTVALMRLLRHEAGHAIENALGLGRRRRWREHFGKRSLPYRQSFSADPSSPDFARNLPMWYAQSHPAEDFAESFAVWLAPRSRARGELSETARAKLACVAELVRERGERRVRERVHRLAELRGTLREHYARRLARRRREPEWAFSPMLRRAFRAREEEAGSRAAKPLLPKSARELRGVLPARWRNDPYSVTQILVAMRERAHVEGLRLRSGDRPPTLRSMGRAVTETLDRLARGEGRIGR